MTTTTAEEESPTAYVDVIIPVHNAAKTIVEAVQSAMHQSVPQHLLHCISNIDVAVCCRDDGSDDDSWKLLLQLQERYKRERNQDWKIRTKLLLSRDGVSRGAGYARNRAASLRGLLSQGDHFLCLLDSDDVMHETRVAEQVCAMLALENRDRTILGCTFDRDPPDSTWHYAQWANGLSDERLMLERYREVTVLQPTWMLPKSRFPVLGWVYRGTAFERQSGNG